MSEDVVAALTAALGDKVVITPDRFEARVFADYSGVAAAKPLALLRPRNTEQVSTALAICNRFGQPVAVQGGLTGMAGGANVQPGEIALTTELMTQIEAVDPVSGTMTVQAGATLDKVQRCADEHGLLFGLDLGARGSCTIGGNIATNAGGLRVIRYGMMRDQVLGVEAVLADGRVMTDLHRMVKNNAGYDFRNLMAGSEGTLGVITRAVLRLRPMPQSVLAAWCGLTDFESVSRFLTAARSRLGDRLSAFELMWASFHDAVIDHVPGVRRPLETAYPFYVLIESSAPGGDGHMDEFEAALAHCLEEGIVADAVIARSIREAESFWAIRECLEFMKHMKHLVGFDVSAASAEVGRMVEACAALVERRWPDSTFLAVGHVGDGNIHIAVDAPDGSAETHRAIEDAVCEVVESFSGSISGEHGIGFAKRRCLHHTRSKVDLEMMRSIKTALDPQGILGRERIFASA